MNTGKVPILDFYQGEIGHVDYYLFQTVQDIVKEVQYYYNVFIPPFFHDKIFKALYAGDFAIVLDSEYFQNLNLKNELRDFIDEYVLPMIFGHNSTLKSNLFYMSHVKKNGKRSIQILVTLYYPKKNWIFPE